MSNNPAMDRIQELLDLMIPFANRFAQFDSVAGNTDEFYALLDKNPHVRVVWDELVKAQNALVTLANAPINKD